ncbi:MAG: ATP-binding protein, partial [Blastochloris sp.]|nr:ATP-binding protein [Blastochloris sp.]
QTGSSRTNPAGNGLGLAIVKGIIERHDGTILLASDPDVGTTFRLMLPRPNRLDVQDGERSVRSTGEFQHRQVESPLGEGHDYMVRQTLNEQPDTVDDDVQERQDTASDADRNEMGAAT